MSVSVVLLLGLFCLSVTSIPAGYPVANPYSLVHSDYPLPYHNGYPQPYQATYQTGYQPGYQSFQSAYQPGYLGGYQTVVVGLGSHGGHVLFPTRGPNAHPVLVPLVPVVQQQQPSRQPQFPDRQDRPLVVNPNQVIRAEAPDNRRHSNGRQEPEEVIDVIVDRKPVTAQ
ncbi:uncharacterized protein LOC142589912 isoform X2 [Dermacentor variabilis]|uniref:uncharacterized protein LOC142589912 isoform X2 n=1 Tax=Dermacentor variabilis TaxID=34621 RepID=UPI003F5B0FDA